MLATMIISNLAVIKKIEINFSKGLTVLSGETGAGKSILIDALLAILGGRVSKDIIRKGENKTTIEACFFIPNSSELGEYLIDDMLNISREIFLDGRNIIKINGSLSNTSVLRELAPKLISIHSQNDNQILFNPENHFKFLDYYGGNTELYNRYLEKYKSYMDICTKIEKDESKDKNDKNQIEYLNFVIKEIEQADIKDGEEEYLKGIKQDIKNYELTKTKIDTAIGALYEDELSAYNFLSIAEDSINGISNLSEVASRLYSIMCEISDISKEIKGSLSYEDIGEYKDIDKLEGRLNEIYQLKMKYGGSVSSVLEKLENSQNELFNIENSENIIKELYAKKEETLVELSGIGEQLSEIRRENALKLGVLIENELKDLMMPNAKFEIRLDKTGDFLKCGMEKVEFLFSANAGMAVAPLAKIASGGEISRVNLAIKSILTGIDPACAFVFDEIDNGIGGRAAQKTAEKMYNLARENQILCVSHLPQIAAMADNHILVSKMEKDNQTITQIEVITDEKRAEELSRMIGGVELTELTTKNAIEILKLAKEYKGQGKGEKEQKNDDFGEQIHLL
jgi:DNA repair protein RecN (Recombination protein N)